MFRDENTDSETDDFIELHTLPHPGRRKRQETQKPSKMATQKRKGGLGRIFGTKKSGNGTKQSSVVPGILLLAQ